MAKGRVCWRQPQISLSASPETLSFLVMGRREVEQGWALLTLPLWRLPGG